MPKDSETMHFKANCTQRILSAYSTINLQSFKTDIRSIVTIKYC